MDLLCGYDSVCCWSGFLFLVMRSKCGVLNLCPDSDVTPSLLFSPFLGEVSPLLLRLLFIIFFHRQSCRLPASPLTTASSVTMKSVGMISITVSCAVGFSSRCLSHLVAGGAKGVDGVAVAVLAARSAGNVPRVGGAAVAVLTNHVWLAGTLTAELITLTLVGGGADPRYRAHRVTHALCTEEERSGL